MVASQAAEPRTPNPLPAATDDLRPRFAELEARITELQAQLSDHLSAAANPAILAQARRRLLAAERLRDSIRPLLGSG